MESSPHAPAPADAVPCRTFSDLIASDRFTLSFNTFLEYAGAALGIIGWLGVRQIGIPQAQMIGFLLWVIGGMTLIAWGYYTKSGGILVISLVNTAMAASALAAVVQTA